MLPLYLQDNTSTSYYQKNRDLWRLLLYENKDIIVDAVGENPKKSSIIHMSQYLPAFVILTFWARYHGNGFA